MKIAHFAPFAPNSCGMYEAARDMLVADTRSGHDAVMVDVGPTNNEGKHIEGIIGQIDNRGDVSITTADPKTVNDADIIVAHTGVPDNWIVKCQAPIIFILHGRPTACFRPEQWGNRHSYSLVAKLAQWPRVKAMVTFWDYHVSFWDVIVPKRKLVCLDAPPIDEKRFSQKGDKYEFKRNGHYNVVLAESLREDIDIYEITSGIIEYAKTNHSTKFHFFAMERQMACWDYLYSELLKYNARGDLWQRRNNMEEVYRAADLLISPHRITVRTIGEALSCGTPVLAAHGNQYATFTTNPTEPKEVARDIRDAMKTIVKDPDAVEDSVRESRKKLSLAHYSEQMNELYERIA